MSEHPVSEQAENLANTLQAVVDAYPPYWSKLPEMPIKAGLELARLVEQLAKQVEAQQ